MRLQQGGLVELVALGTSQSDWLDILNRLGAEGFEIQTTDSLDDTPCNLLNFLKEDENDSTCLIRVKSTGGQTWTSTLPVGGPVVMQGDPREIASLEELNSVRNLMHLIHAVTHKPVILIPEAGDVYRTRPYVRI
ncbi:hypothetical protein [Streptomyces sp. NPDC047070]|uniref:hypothetical protein n=1 Tax=Streptomyces sp. NPDC047070 TaxID=3154923 RepID=UPI003454BD9B